jgi:hypothetical protein
MSDDKNYGEQTKDSKNSIGNYIIAIFDKIDAVANRIEPLTTYIKQHKLLVGVSSTALSAIFLTSFYWLINQNFGWDNIANAPPKGSFNPIFGNLEVPLLIISISLLLIGITLLYLGKKERK